jgi:segregation and condensation protein B
MSLKAKLEAVIYAAEEPVTLAQLAALFAADALEWKALEEAASADEAVNEEAQPLQLVNGEFAYIEQERVPELIPEPNLEPVLADSLPVERESVPVELDSVPAELAAETLAEAGPESGGEISIEPDAEAAVGASPAVEPYFATGANSAFAAGVNSAAQSDLAAEPDLAAETDLAAEFNPATASDATADSSLVTDSDSAVQASSATESDLGAEASSEANSEADPAGAAAVLPASGEKSGEGSPAPAAEAVASAESEARRLARLRDREVRAILRRLLDELIASCASDDRGVEIREIAGGYRMATKPECHDAVRLFVKSLKPALKLSLPALETLAVIAYKQPVTAPEVNEIRGVDSSGVFGSLLARKLISTAGRKPVIGRPILYKTTREFLLRFGLKDVSELPSIEEFEKMAASELDEPETGEEPAQEPPNPATGPEFDETTSEDQEELEETPAEGLESPTETIEPAFPTETAETAVSNEPTNPAEATPAAPPPTEQEEIETFSNDEEEN